jgi:hypothetical protein
MTSLGNKYGHTKKNRNHKKSSCHNPSLRLIIRVRAWQGKQIESMSCESNTFPQMWDNAILNESQLSQVDSQFGNQKF